MRSELPGAYISYTHARTRGSPGDGEATHKPNTAGMKKKITIAIDGLSSCGKSTMARELARELGYVYIDSGAMYRAVTLHALRQGLVNGGLIDESGLRDSLPDITIEFAINPSTGAPITLLNGHDVEREIRSLEVSNMVSPVAALPFVRQRMVELQRRMGAGGGVVMDGRDIGTTVFPDAELKVFVTASPEVRARRRYDELEAKGQPASLNDILDNIKRRDQIDTTRKVSPLRMAPDAIVLDNSRMTLRGQSRWLLARARWVIGRDYSS